jgi:hypothetical protein
MLRERHQDTHPMICPCGYIGDSEWRDDGTCYDGPDGTRWTHDYQEGCPGCEDPVFNPENYHELRDALRERGELTEEGVAAYIEICEKADNPEALETSRELLEMLDEEIL